MSYLLHSGPHNRVCRVEILFLVRRTFGRIDPHISVYLAVHPELTYWDQNMKFRLSIQRRFGF